MMPSTEDTWTNVISLTRFRVTLSSASTYMVPCSLALSGNMEKSDSYSAGMKERQVLVIMNLLKLSSGHVVSNLGIAKPPPEAFVGNYREIGAINFTLG